MRVAHSLIDDKWYTVCGTKESKQIRNRIWSRRVKSKPSRRKRNTTQSRAQRAEAQHNRNERQQTERARETNRKSIQVTATSTATANDVNNQQRHASWRCVKYDVQMYIKCCVLNVKHMKLAFIKMDFISLSYILYYCQCYVDGCLAQENVKS